MRRRGWEKVEGRTTMETDTAPSDWLVGVGVRWSKRRNKKVGRSPETEETGSPLLHCDYGGGEGKGVVRV